MYAKPKKIKSLQGQALTEYLILTALIGVASIAMVQVFSSNLRSRLAVISEAIRGHRTQIEGVEARERHYQIRDLGDFQEAIQDNEHE